MESSSGRRAYWREAARSDVGEALDWYLSEGGSDLATRLVRAIDELERSIALFPSMGSSRYAMRIRDGSLRFRKVDGFPYLIFYAEHDEGVQILRVLHESRDIPQHMR